MRKLLNLCLFTITASACYEPSGETPEFREGINAEFETLEAGVKLLNGCVTIDRPVTFTLVESNIYADGLQSFSVTIESVARVNDVDCILEVLEANQP